MEVAASGLVLQRWLVQAYSSRGPAPTEVTGFSQFAPTDISVSNLPGFFFFFLIKKLASDSLEKRPNVGNRVN